MANFLARIADNPFMVATLIVCFAISMLLFRARVVRERAGRQKRVNRSPAATESADPDIRRSLAG